MKIEFDKALLWLVPYLYLVSVAYYWGYWGSFDIDIFNYYPVSDLVKGVTAPLGGSLVLVTGFGFILFFLKNHFNSTNNSRTSIILSIIGTLSAFAIISYFKRGDQSVYAFTGLRTKAVICVAVVVALSALIDNRLPETTKLNDAIRGAAVLFLLFLPFQAHLDGLHRALKIQFGQEFDYVVTDSLMQTEHMYKYLGKAGDYQVLLSQNNNTRIIISSDKLDPLVIERFTLEDSASIRRFNVHKKKQLPPTTRPK